MSIIKAFKHIGEEINSDLLHFHTNDFTKSRRGQELIVNPSKCTRSSISSPVSHLFASPSTFHKCDKSKNCTDNLSTEAVTENCSPK